MKTALLTVIHKRAGQIIKHGHQRLVAHEESVTWLDMIDEGLINAQALEPAFNTIATGFYKLDE